MDAEEIAEEHPVDMEQEAVDSEPEVSDEDLATCMRVLHALAGTDGVREAYRQPRFKPLRSAMQLYLDDARARQFHGQRPDKYALRKEKQRQQNAREQQKRAIDRDDEDKTRMRAERLKMLSALEESAAATTGGDAALLTFVPDGAAAEDAPRAQLTHTAADDASSTTSQLTELPRDTHELQRLHACYTCKRRFGELHHFYAALCPACAALNYAKRTQTAPLDGTVFLVTGARVKIGFHVALKLLRCGATVLATSRFPADTATRFTAERDFDVWGSRLQVYGLDLRDLAALERFCAFLLSRTHRLDGLINNACQTIRRPAAYYAHLLPLELDAQQWAPRVRTLLADHVECFMPKAPPTATLLAPPAADASADAGAEAGGCADATGAGAASAPAGALTSAAGGAITSGGATTASSVSSVPSALWSQAPLWSAEGMAQPDAGSASDFPLGVRDVNGQQLDTRRVNSWLLKHHEVSTPEAAEVLAINTLAPFVLNGRLRCLLEASPAAARFVVNVSAMEGKFYRYKSANHPHTNMAKAALNMMTRTCAEELAANRIYMNSVDTGWINDEKPIELAAEHASRHHFQTPLDEVDAAARILDPVLSVVNGAPPVHGKFLKDYQPVEW